MLHKVRWDLGEVSLYGLSGSSAGTSGGGWHFAVVEVRRRERALAKRLPGEYVGYAAVFRDDELHGMWLNGVDGEWVTPCRMRRHDRVYASIWRARSRSR